MRNPKASRSTRMLARAYLAAVLAFLFAPLAVVVLFSFHSVPRMSLPFEGFSLRWYDEVLHDPVVTDAMVRSATAAALTGLLSGILGLSIALALVGARQRVRTATMVAALILVPTAALLLVP